MNDILLGIRVAKLEEKFKELERLLEMRWLEEVAGK